MNDDKLYERIGHLEAGFAELAASMKSLQVGQDRLLSKSDQPTNWVGIGGLMFVVFGFLVTLMQLSTGSNRTSIDTISSEVKTRAALVYESPKRFEALEHLLNDTRDWQRTVSDRVMNIEKLSAQNNTLNQWHNTWLSTVESQLDIERARNALIEQRTSKTEGELERLTNQVTEIDIGGSRRWNSDNEP